MLKSEQFEFFLKAILRRVSSRKNNKKKLKTFQNKLKTSCTKLKTRNFPKLIADAFDQAIILRKRPLRLQNYSYKELYVPKILDAHCLAPLHIIEFWVYRDPINYRDDEDLRLGPSNFSKMLSACPWYTLDCFVVHATCTCVDIEVGQDGRCI